MNTQEIKRKVQYLIATVLLSSGVTASLMMWMQNSNTQNQNNKIEIKELKTSLIEKTNNSKVVEVENKQKDNSIEIQNSLQDLRSQYAKLNKEIERLRQQKSMENSNPLEEAQLTMAEQDAVEQQQRVENLMLMEETLYSEPVDDTWSLSSEMAVMDSLANVSDQLNVESVECASTLCALHIAGNGNSAGSDVMHSFSRNINWQGEMTMQYDLNTGKGVAYLAREGHSLPGAAQDGG